MDFVIVSYQEALSLKTIYTMVILKAKKLKHFNLCKKRKQWYRHQSIAFVRPSVSNPTFRMKVVLVTKLKSFLSSTSINNDNASVVFCALQFYQLELCHSCNTGKLQYAKHHR
jgi:hypothetical protein